MKNILLAVVTLACSFALAKPTQKDLVTVKEINSLYAKMSAAYSKKDVAGILANCTADCTFSGGGSTMNVSQVRDLMKAQLTSAKSVKARMTPANVVVKGTTANVTSSNVFTIVIANPQTKKDSTVVQKSTTKDVWIKQGKSWKMKSSQQNLTELSVDGKKQPINTKN